MSNMNGSSSTTSAAATTNDAIANTNNTASTAAAIAATTTTPTPKQGFRFSKSGVPSPIPPSVKRIPSQPSLISESNPAGSLSSSQLLNRSNHSQPPSGPSNNNGNNSNPAQQPSFSRSLSSSSLHSQSEIPSGVDPKLFQVVKRIISSTPSLLVSSGGGGKTTQQARKNNIAAVTSLVLDRHREYKRKDINWVKSGIEGALGALGSAAASNSNNNSNTAAATAGNSKKRKSSSIVPVGGGSNPESETTSSTAPALNSSVVAETKASPASPSKKKKAKDITNFDSNQSDIEVDKSFDTLEENTSGNSFSSLENSNNHLIVTTAQKPVNTGGMLNASLQKRYCDMQREREKGDATNNHNASNDVTVPSPTSQDAATSATANNTNATPAAAASSSVTPKKKKKASKKLSSRTNNNTASNQSSYDNNLDDPSSASGTLLLPSPRPSERYSNLGGISSLLQQLRELIEYPLSHPELFLHLGVEPPRGVLLRGPPGCGKTHLAKAIAGELNVSYFQVSAPELVGGVSGESELRVRTLFESAARYAPAIIFIDEIDAIAPKRGEGGGGGGGGKSMEKRIVAQLLTSMDSIHPENTRNQSAVMVLGATNRPDAMDPALRRAGRFDREIVLGAPDESAREAILRVMTKEMRVEGDLDYKVLARKTPGFVGADVRSLTKEAAVLAINRIFKSELLSGGGFEGGGNKNDDVAKEGTCAKQEGEDPTDTTTSGGANNESVEETNATKADESKENARNDIQSITPLTEQQLQPLYITMEDFLAAITHVQPSSKREGFATVPGATWNDIGALGDIREELTLSVLEPISHPERFEALGLPLPAGVLLYGPPGCGKTLLAKAIANESGANFISVKGPELLDKYVGESERSVRVVFERARSSSPCIIFFDELDSLCPKRGSDGGGGGGVSERVVNQLLTEMDGLDSRRSVFVIAATNRPELIDPAMLRPGRLDKLLYVPLPSPDDRFSILRALATKIKLASDVDLRSIAHNPHANGFSGADCAALLREAGLAVLRDGVLSRSENDGKEEAVLPLQITAHHFQYAFDHVLPSVSKKDQARYDKLRDRMARARTREVGASAEERGKGDVSDAEASAPPPGEVSGNI